MSQRIRLLRPDRFQRQWDVIDLDSQRPPEHRARLVEGVVGTLNLSGFYALIKARDDLPGRPASDPAVLLAIRLYATLDAIGSTHANERLIGYHAAYRCWAGGVPVNHNMLSAFRRDSGARLDTLLIHSQTALIAEGLIGLEQVAIDSTKVRARAWCSSLAGRERNRRAGSHAPRKKPRKKLRKRYPLSRPPTLRRVRCGCPTGRRIWRGTCKSRPRMASSSRSTRPTGDPTDRRPDRPAQ